MTSSKPDAPFTPNPLWAPPPKAFALKEAVAEDAPFRPLGLAACMRPVAVAAPEDASAATEASVDDASQPVLPETSEAVAAIRAAAHQEGFEVGRARGDQEGYARGLEEGREAGHSAGYEAGLGAGRAEAQESNHALEALLAAVIAALGEAETPLSPQLGAFRRLTLHLVETVLRRELAEGHDLVTPLLERALEELDERGAGTVCVSLCPTDYDALHEALGSRFAELSFEADAAVPSGSVSLKAGASVVDDFLAQRLETLAQEWLGEARGWRPERLATPLTPRARSLDDVAEGEWSPLEGDGPLQAPEDPA